MSILHFLNVRQGDCTIIQHNSDRVTMIDVNNARNLNPSDARVEEFIKLASRGNFNRKEHPTNPLSYMEERDIDTVFRFVLTHPDMDHMDGIKDIFESLSPPNFWDTANTCEKNDWGDGGPYREEDWDFYKSLRSGTAAARLVYHSGGARKDFWAKDGLHVLSPTRALISAANECEEWNDSSYVILYRVAHIDPTQPSWKAVIAGDSHDATWEHVLNTHQNQVRNLDVLLAPHHAGRAHLKAREIRELKHRGRTTRPRPLCAVS